MGGAVRCGRVWLGIQDPLFADSEAGVPVPHVGLLVRFRGGGGGG